MMCLALRGWREGRGLHLRRVDRAVVWRRVWPCLQCWCLLCFLWLGLFLLVLGLLTRCFLVGRYSMVTVLLFAAGPMIAFSLGYLLLCRVRIG